jgi:hypothetical protein
MVLETWKKNVFLGVKCGWCVGLTTLPPSMSRLSRQCGIFNISQPYRPQRPVMRIALLFFSICLIWIDILAVMRLALHSRSTWLLLQHICQWLNWNLVLIIMWFHSRIIFLLHSLVKNGDLLILSESINMQLFIFYIDGLT